VDAGCVGWGGEWVGMCLIVVHFVLEFLVVCEAVGVVCLCEGAVRHLWRWVALFHFEEEEFVISLNSLIMLFTSLGCDIRIFLAHGLCQDACNVLICGLTLVVC
jgi:hypothetical protein